MLENVFLLSSVVALLFRESLLLSVFLCFPEKSVKPEQ